MKNVIIVKIWFECIIDGLLLRLFVVLHVKHTPKGLMRSSRSDVW